MKDAVSSAVAIPPAVALLPTLRIRPATMSDIRAILVVHREAFADKFRCAFGNKRIARGTEALAAAWQRQGIASLHGMFVAEWHGTIVGTTMLRTWDMATGYSGATEQVFHQVLGLWGAARSIFALSLLNHRINPNEGFITDVAVLTSFRRRGVARKLLNYAEERAQSQRKSYLGLYVSSTNRGARLLYEHLGFRQVRVRRSWLMRLIFHQRDWIYMRKNLTQSNLPHTVTR
ncbi:MAG: GNAT family N-acetyltransferase [Chloroflexaceae bacterium]|nr:GNAT family N-acetyltransferase [Chloroflexaceae bacterium]